MVPSTRAEPRSATASEPPPHGWAWFDLATRLVEACVARGPDGAEELRPEADRALDGALLRFEQSLAGDDPFAAVVAMAELDQMSAQVLAVCAAVSIDRRLQRLAATLRHDAAARTLDVAALSAIVGPEAAFAALAPDGALAATCLLTVEAAGPVAAAQVEVARRLSWAVLGDSSLDPELPLETELFIAPDGALGSASMVCVHGVDRTRRLQSAIVHTLGVGFLVVAEPGDDTAWRAVVREATVSGLGVVLDLRTAGAALHPTTRYWIERAAHLSFAVCTAHPIAVDALPDREFVEVAADPPTITDDEWRGVFGSRQVPPRLPSADQLRLAGKVAAATTTPEAAIGRVAAGSLVKHATRITPRVGWDELILPKAQERRLRQLVDRYRYRGVVHDEWGLPLYPSPGVVALFSGPSGTGKTTTAEVIAHELGVDMFRVDLSALVSKYIGETEKNLEEIFSAAHAGDYLLLFDEADSLFGTRSKVSDARDRYANMEVSYLLQRLESYDGFVVLTSNFQGNIDQAFLRRIHVTVHFAVPSVAERARIWHRSLGNAPRAEVDLGFVAEKFDLTGGSIRNAALTAAFYAAGGARPVGMVDLLLAVTEEMIKLGRRPTDDQYGRWLTELKD